jgi:hypothetical protein
LNINSVSSVIGSLSIVIQLEFSKSSLVRVTISLPFWYNSPCSNSARSPLTQIVTGTDSPINPYSGAIIFIPLP